MLNKIVCANASQSCIFKAHIYLVCVVCLTSIIMRVGSIKPISDYYIKYKKQI